MTEQKWLVVTDPDLMVEFVLGTASKRKLRLFACACCRLAWQDFEEDRIKELVVTSESYADETSDLDQLRSAWRAASRAYADNQGDAGNQDVEEAALGCGVELNLSEVMRWASEAIAFEDWDEHVEVLRDPTASQEQRNLAFGEVRNRRGINAKIAYVGLIRDIFGNPFHPVTLDPRWQSSTVLDLARTIYEQRTFEHLPILADALMDAGCDSEEIIQHCQGPEPHVRGCWVVDLLLGKE